MVVVVVVGGMEVVVWVVWCSTWWMGRIPCSTMPALQFTTEGITWGKGRT